MFPRISKMRFALRRVARSARTPTASSRPILSDPTFAFLRCGLGITQCLKITLKVSFLKSKIRKKAGKAYSARCYFGENVIFRGNVIFGKM